MHGISFATQAADKHGRVKLGRDRATHPPVHQADSYDRHLSVFRWQPCIGVLVLSACSTSHATLDLANGERCPAQNACGERSCIADVSQAPKDNTPLAFTCAELSDAMQEGERCTHGTECARGICLLSGVCAKTCVDDSDCTSTTRCSPTYARTSNTTLQPLSACVAWNTLAFSQVSTAVDASAAAQQISLTISRPRPLAWVLYPSKRAQIIFDRLDAQGAIPTTLFDAAANADKYAAAPLLALASLQGPATITLPSDQDLAPDATTLTLNVRASTNTTLTVFESPAPITANTLNLEIFTIGNALIEQLGTTDAELLSTALAHLSDDLQALGIVLNHAEQHSVPGLVGHSLRSINNIDTFPNGALCDLFETTAGIPTPTINVFFVERVGGVRALSNGIPAAPGFQGTCGSGLALAVDTLIEQGDWDAHRLAVLLFHEIGHFMGLAHTSESDGAVHESLNDTPECRANQEARTTTVASIATNA